MAAERKAKEHAGANEGAGPPAETEAAKGVGVTASGVRPVPAAGAAGGGTATARLMAVYDSIAPQLRAHLLRHGVSATNVEDATQKLLVAVLPRAQSDEPLDNPSAYLFKTAETTALRFVEDQRRHPLVAGDEDEGEHEIAAPSSRQGLFQKTLRAERMGMLEDGFETLSPADAGILLMAYTEGLSQAEIAEKLGITAEAVRKRLKRALEELREKVLCHCTDDDLEEGAA